MQTGGKEVLEKFRPTILYVEEYSDGLIGETSRKQCD